MPESAPQLITDFNKSLKGGRKRRGNASLKAWVKFVKKVAREEKLPYGAAMKRAKVRKDKGEKWMMGGEVDEAKMPVENRYEMSADNQMPVDNQMPAVGDDNQMPVVDGAEDEEYESPFKPENSAYGGRRRRHKKSHKKRGGSKRRRHRGTKKRRR